MKKGMFNQPKIERLFSFCFIFFNLMFSGLYSQNLVAHYDFNNALTDKLNGSVLDTYNETNDGYNHNNTSTGFGNDTNGNFWQWASGLARGGGLWVDVNTNISTNYSVGVRFSFVNTESSYRKIIDFKNLGSDNGFYFYSGGKLNFYPNQTLGLSTTTNNTIVDIIITRNASDKKFIAYIITNGEMLKELEVTDSNNDAVPELIKSKPRFHFFHDDNVTNTEASPGGKVYSIKIWDAPITALEAETAMNVTDFVWNGSSSSTLGAAQNWDENLIPTPSANLIIPQLSGEAPIYPQLANDMTIAKLILKPGAQFTVNESKTLTANDTVILESDDTKTAQLLNNGTITNNAKLVLRKKLKMLSGWYFMSFPYDVPLSNIKLGGTETTASTSDFRAATGPTYSDIYIIAYNGARRDQTGTATTSNSPNWDAVTSGTLQAGKGYAFLVMSDKTIDFVSATGATGMFDITHKATAVGTYTNNSNTAHHSWNLVGVPYTSAFNLANLDQSTFYYLYNQAGQNYEIKEQVDNFRLYPFSAFFMQASATTLNFSTLGRALKIAALSQQTAYDEIEMQLSNSTFADYTRIRIDNTAGVGYTINEDAVKMLSPNNTVPQVWTTSGPYDLAVNSQPPTIKEIPLHLRLGQSGSYTLKFVHPEKMTRLERISLVDMQENQIVDLRQADSYTFIAGAGQITNRFKIVTNTDISTINKSTSLATIQLNVSTNGFYLDGLGNKAEVKVTDLNGRVLYQFKGVENKTFINVKLTGLCIFSINTTDACLNVKKFIF